MPSPIIYPGTSPQDITNAVTTLRGNVLYPYQGFGATGTNRILTDAAVTTGGAFTSATANLLPTGASVDLLVGANIAIILPAGAYNSIFITTIASISSGTAAQLTVNPPAGGSNLQCVIWFDDTPYLQACANALLPGQVMDGGNLLYFTSGFVPPNLDPPISIQNFQLYPCPGCPSMWGVPGSYPNSPALSGSGIIYDGRTTPVVGIRHRNVKFNGLRSFFDGWYQYAGGGRSGFSFIGTQARVSFQDIHFDDQCESNYCFSDGLTVACYTGTAPTNNLLSSADGIYWDGKLQYNRRSGSQIQGALNVVLGPNHDISCNGVDISGCLLPRTWLPAGGTPETPVLEGDMGEQSAGVVGLVTPTSITFAAGTATITKGDQYYWPLQVGNPYVNLTYNPQLAPPIGFRLDNGRWWITTLLNVAAPIGSGPTATSVVTLGSNPPSSATAQPYECGGIYGLGVLFEPFGIGDSLRNVRITGGRAIGNAGPGYSEDENNYNIFASDYIPGGPMSLTGVTFDCGQNLPNNWNFEPSYNATRVGIGGPSGAQPCFDGLEIVGCKIAGTLQFIQIDHPKITGVKSELQNLPYTGTIPAWSSSRDYSSSSEVVLYAGLVWEASPGATGNVNQTPGFGSTYWGFPLAPAQFIQCRYHECLGVETIPPYIQPYSQYYFAIAYGTLTSVTVALSGGVYTATLVFPEPHLLNVGQRVQFHSNGTDFPSGANGLDLSVATIVGSFPSSTSLTINVTTVPSIAAGTFTGSSILLYAQDYNEGPYNVASNNLAFPNGGGIYLILPPQVPNGPPVLQQVLDTTFSAGNQVTRLFTNTGGALAAIKLILRSAGVTIGGSVSGAGSIPGGTFMVYDAAAGAYTRCYIQSTAAQDAYLPLIATVLEFFTSSGASTGTGVAQDGSLLLSQANANKLLTLLLAAYLAVTGPATPGYVLGVDSGGTAITLGPVAAGGLPNVGPGAGTYTVGNRITPVTGNLGMITLDNQGRVTDVQEAT